EKYTVYFAVPQNKHNEKVKLLIQNQLKYVHTPIDRRGMNPFKDLKLIKSYNKVIQDINPDIILTYTIKPNIYGNYVANKFDIPVIMNITGLGTSLISGRLKLFIKFLYKYACNKAKIIFFQNQSNKDFFINQNLILEDKAKLTSGSGVNIQKFLPENKSSNNSKIRFLFIGRLMKEKGIEEYLEAANLLTDIHKNLEFQILGSFEEEKYKNILEENKNP